MAESTFHLQILFQGIECLDLVVIRLFIASSLSWLGQDEFPVQEDDSSISATGSPSVERRMPRPFSLRVQARAQ